MIDFSYDETFNLNEIIFELKKNSHPEAHSDLYWYCAATNSIKNFSYEHTIMCE